MSMDDRHTEIPLNGTTDRPGTGSSRRAQEPAAQERVDQVHAQPAPGEQAVSITVSGTRKRISVGLAGEMTRLRGVTRAVLDLGSPGLDPARLTLSLNLHQAVVDGEMRVELDEATRQLLIACGWAPPRDNASAPGE